jgi:hypothetical protein
MLARRHQSLQYGCVNNGDCTQLLVIDRFPFILKKFSRMYKGNLKKPNPFLWICYGIKSYYRINSREELLFYKATCSCW